MLAALLFAPSGAFAQSRRGSQPLTPEQREALVERADELVRGRAYAAGVDFARWEEIRDRYRDRINSAESTGTLTAVLNRALRELGISHLEILPPEAAVQINRTSMSGIGITSQPSGQGVLVVKLVENAPAQKAGVRVGDTIIEVDGKPYSDADQIRGPAGTKVRIKVEREDGSTAEFVITRASFSTIEPETLERLDEEAFKLTVPTFAAGYDRDNIQKLLREARGGKYLVIDLRNNGGGDFANMVHFLSCLLPPGTQIGTQVSREMAERFKLETDGDPDDPVAVAKWSSRKSRTWRSSPVKPFDGKIAVLINRGSASASEIVAAALSELRGAPLVGSRTAGAVLVSTYNRMSDGFLMKVPLSEWVTIKGRRLEGNPLVAEVQVPFSRRGAEESVAVEKALERLRQD